MENDLSGDGVVTLLTLTHQQAILDLAGVEQKAIGLDWHPGLRGGRLG
jgi:hypothetical protein